MTSRDNEPLRPEFPLDLPEVGALLELARAFAPEPSTLLAASLAPRRRSSGHGADAARSSSARPKPATRPSSSRSRRSLSWPPLKMGSARSTSVRTSRLMPRGIHRPRMDRRSHPLVPAAPSRRQRALEQGILPHRLLGRAVQAPIDRFLAKDGRSSGSTVRPRWFATNPVSLPSFRALAMTLPNLKRAEEVLRAIAAKNLEQLVRSRTAELGAFKAALDEHPSSSSPIRQGRITYANDKFCAISSYSSRREELHWPGSSPHQFRISSQGIHPRFVDHHRPRPRLARRDPESGQGRFLLLGGDDDCPVPQ